MLRSLLPPGIELTASCTGAIASDNVELLTLVTNELVTNAAKYAFPDRSTGRVVVGYRQEGQGGGFGSRTTGRACPPISRIAARVLSVSSSSVFSPAASER